MESHPASAKKTKIEWTALDWQKSNRQLAEETGRTPEHIRQRRLAFFPPESLQRPPDWDLEDSAKATALKFRVPWTVANHWHLEAGKPGKPGPRAMVLPEDFIPTTLKADAKRLGVAVFTLWKAMRRQGIRPGRGKGSGDKWGAQFTLPADFVPTTFRGDAKRFGVKLTTLWKAMQRQGFLRSNGHAPLHGFPVAIEGQPPGQNSLRVPRAG